MSMTPLWLHFLDDSIYTPTRREWDMNCIMFQDLTEIPWKASGNHTMFQDLTAIAQKTSGSYGIYIYICIFINVYVLLFGCCFKFQTISRSQNRCFRQNLHDLSRISIQTPWFLASAPGNSSCSQTWDNVWWREQLHTTDIHLYFGV